MPRIPIETATPKDVDLPSGLANVLARFTDHRITRHGAQAALALAREPKSTAVGQMGGQSGIDSISEIATTCIELEGFDHRTLPELGSLTSISLEVLHGIIRTALGRSTIASGRWSSIARPGHDPCTTTGEPLIAKQPPAPACVMCSLTTEHRSEMSSTPAHIVSTA